MTATYWEIGRRIVEFEQRGKERARYGEELLKRLSLDLSEQFGRGFSRPNLQRFRDFYQSFPLEQIRSTASSESQNPIRSTLSSNSRKDKTPVSLNQNPQTLSAKSSVSILPTLSGEIRKGGPQALLLAIAQRFPLPWSHYVRLLSARSDEARAFYEAEALRGGWSVRQLDRQINSLFYERTAALRDKAAMLKKGTKSLPGEALTADEAIRDPLVLEFLDLKDEYSETELEEALVKHLETFLLELGGDFAFVGRQRRLRIDDEW